MGLNISLYKMDEHGEWQEHPTWDTFRYAGDRDIPPLIAELGAEDQCIGHPYDCVYYVRPLDPDAFEKATCEKFRDMNAERWKVMAQAFRDGWWAYFSY